MDEYNEDDITEALRQKLRGESLDLTPDSYNRLLRMDLTKVDVPTYPADLVGGLLRGAESYTTAPMRSAQASIYSGDSNPISAAYKQMGEEASSAPSEADIDSIARQRLAKFSGNRIADAALLPSDISSILSQAEIKGIIPGGLDQKIAKEIEYAAKLRKGNFPSPSELHPYNIQKDLLDITLARPWVDNYGARDKLMQIRKPREEQLKDLQLAYDEGLNVLQAGHEAQQSEKHAKDLEKYGINIDSFKNRGKIRPATGLNRTRAEVFKDLSLAFPGTYNAKAMSDSKFIKSELDFWTKEAQRGYPDAAETADFFQSELNRIMKPRSVKGKIKLVN